MGEILIAVIIFDEINCSSPVMVIALLENTSVYSQRISCRGYAGYFAVYLYKQINSLADEKKANTKTSCPYCVLHLIVFLFLRQYRRVSS